MNGVDLIPRPETLQVPSLMFRILLTLTFVLHLVLMNIALGGSILNAAYRLRRGKAAPGSAGLPSTIALAVNLGVPPLLFVQVLFGQFFYSSSVLMASYWLAVVPLLILAYYAAYIMQGRKGRKEASRAGAAWSVLSALLLLCIAFIYVNNMSLMLRYGEWPNYFADKRGLMLALSDPALFPRFLHFVVGALAVASISWSAWARFRERRAAARGERAPEVGGAKAFGLKLFWIFTAIQAPIGMAWLGTLPRETMRLFMGGSAYGTILLCLGLFLAAGLLAHAIMGKFGIAAGILAATMVVMVLMRDLIRTSALSPVFKAGDLKVEPQYGPFVLFAVALAGGIAVLAWILHKALAAPSVQGGDE
jgi:hypothetical protein